MLDFDLYCLLYWFRLVLFALSCLVCLPFLSSSTCYLDICGWYCTCLKRFYAFPAYTPCKFHRHHWTCSDYYSHVWIVLFLGVWSRICCFVLVFYLEISYPNLGKLATLLISSLSMITWVKRQVIAELYIFFPFTLEWGIVSTLLLCLWVSYFVGCLLLASYLSYLSLIVFRLMSHELFFSLHFLLVFFHWPLCQLVCFNVWEQQLDIFLCSWMWSTVRLNKIWEAHKECLSI